MRPSSGAASSDGTIGLLDLFNFFEMKTLYLDIFSGISGDMLIGALIDLGVDAHRLEHELEKLQLEDYHLHVGRGHKASIEGVKFDVHIGHHHDHASPVTHSSRRSQTKADHKHHHHAHGHPHHHHDAEDHEHEHEHTHGRTFSDIKHLIARSSLSAWVKEKSIAVFNRIAAAEGRIHGLPPEEVHFHEVGAVDSIVDIVGACICLEMLGKTRVLASPVVEGAGWIDCAHGRFPIPAPATLQILAARGIAVTQCDEPHELVTPTGAALLAEFVETFGPMRDLTPGKIGFGLGTRDNKTRPNVLRVVEGFTPRHSTLDTRHSAHDWEADKVAVLETNLDDLNPELLGHFIENALVEGALDVFYTPIQMKKNRPAVLLTILCTEKEADRFTELLLRETSTFGVRRYTAERRKLMREFTKVKTEYGEVKVKIGKLNGEIIQAAPEFASCKEIASAAGVPLKKIYEAVNKTPPLQKRKAVSKKQKQK